MRWLEFRVPPVAVVLAAVAAMRGLARFSSALHYPITGHLALALIIGVLGVLVSVAGITAFRSARTTVNPRTPNASSALVTSGIYRRTRNPMYLGLGFVLVAWAAYRANPLSLLVIPGFVAYLNCFQIGPEERALRIRFGSQFAQYERSVRRWL